MSMTPLQELRHSAAHMLAAAVLRKFPDAKLDIGPPTDTGFYYDFDLDHRFTPEDLESLEAEMKGIAKENQKFERREVTREEARSFFEQRSQTYKLSRLDDIPEGEPVTFYQNGEFTDLCAGTHVGYSSKVKAFKLLSIAGAYHRGDEKNAQLQRIYGTAFPTKAELDEHLVNLEEAKRRDHRKIGKAMELFAFDEDVGPGLPLWLPRGTVLVEELEKLAKETEFAAGYHRVRTPHLARESMYRLSGHLPYYADSMFPPMELASERDGQEAERYYIKAMNCPHHHKIYAAVPRSYRDLPLRLAEYGACYRYEQSGELLGLMRVRSMQMNDAHIYCTETQFEEEFMAVNDMYLKYFGLFGLGKYLMRFSTHDPARLGQKYVDRADLWKATEDMVRNVLKKSGINFIEVPDEAAFYGPKIDVQVWSAVGREFTIATNQVDFAVPRQFGLVYRDSDNSEKTPLCIHRAPLGTHERFIAFLIEHYAGNFPLWLAPDQVRILTIGNEEPLVEFAGALHRELRAAGVRCEMDPGTDKINGKIQRAEQLKVHTMLVIGKRDLEAGQVSVRVHGKGNLGAKPRDEVVADILASIRERRND